MLFSFGQNYAKYSFMGGKNVLIGGHVLIHSPCSSCGKKLIWDPAANSLLMA